MLNVTLHKNKKSQLNSGQYKRNSKKENHYLCK
jgi:hypothetical protein